jgi:hypothetical protein
MVQDESCSPLAAKEQVAESEILICSTAAWQAEQVLHFEKIHSYFPYRLKPGIN